MEGFLVRVLNGKQAWMCDHASQCFINLFWKYISENIKTKLIVLIKMLS